MGSRQRGRLISEADKTEAIYLINEALAAGSRLKPACELLELDVRTFQRWQHKDRSLKDQRCGPLTTPSNKLTDAEREEILRVSNSAEYCNQSPCQIVPNLADKGLYLGCESSFYRILKEVNLLAHRGKAKKRSHRKPDELSASKPNELWSWDITYLMTNIRGKYFYLYLFMDVFSRKIVGYKVFERESAELASEVIAKACADEGVEQGRLILHSDNGGPMKGSTMLATLQRLGVVPSFSRPSVSDDNAYSEALFKTLKYCHQYPSQPFSSVDEANAWVEKFVHWYNNIHHHSGISFVTPASRHQGLDVEILEKRTNVYEIAKQKNPNRWSGQTRNWDRINSVYLNTKRTSCNGG